jgi:hypothetical protein
VLSCHSVASCNTVVSGQSSAAASASGQSAAYDDTTAASHCVSADHSTACDHSASSENDGLPHNTAVFSMLSWPVELSQETSGEGASTTSPGVRSAARMSSTPAPVANGSPTATLRADRIRRALTEPGFSEGSCSSINAAVAATNGAAMLVPDICM